MNSNLDQIKQKEEILTKKEIFIRTALQVFFYYFRHKMRQDLTKEQKRKVQDLVIKNSFYRSDLNRFEQSLLCVGKYKKSILPAKIVDGEIVADIKQFDKTTADMADYEPKVGFVLEAKNTFSEFDSTNKNFALGLNMDGELAKDNYEEWLKKFNILLSLLDTHKPDLVFCPAFAFEPNSALNLELTKRGYNLIFSTICQEDTNKFLFFGNAILVKGRLPKDTQIEMMIPPEGLTTKNILSFSKTLEEMGKNIPMIYNQLILKFDNLIISTNYTSAFLTPKERKQRDMQILKYYQNLTHGPNLKFILAGDFNTYGVKTDGKVANENNLSLLADFLGNSIENRLASRRFAKNSLMYLPSNLPIIKPGVFGQPQVSKILDLRLDAVVTNQDNLKLNSQRIEGVEHPAILFEI